MATLHGLKWRVSIWFDGKTKTLDFSTEEDARNFERYRSAPLARKRPHRIPSIMELLPQAKAEQRIAPSRNLDRMLHAIGALAHKPGSEVTLEAIAKLLAQWEYAHATKHLYFKMLKQALHAVGYIEPYFETLRLALPKMRQPVARSVTVSERTLQILYDDATSYFSVTHQGRPPSASADAIHFLMFLWCDTALRFAEGMSIRPRMIDFDSGVARFTQKGNRERTMIFTERIVALARKCRDRDERCVDQLAGRFVSASSVRRWLARAKERYDLRDFTFHDFRRTAATGWERDTRDTFAVKELLGHDSITSTIAYLKPFGPQKMKEIVERCKPQFGQEEKAS